MRVVLSVLIITVAFYVTSASRIMDDQDVTVTTDLGRIRGTVLKSRLGEDFYAFRGIRYAKAPVGDLRFKAPVPVDSWTDVYDATEDGPICPQWTFDTLNASEDCLRLNVYTKQLPSESSPNVKKPVIIYLHPGGFYSYSGESKTFTGPQPFMDRDIVLVTINYRLSSLGFLATGTPEAPGNAGLKDQVLAMKWVKNHIAKFGGDPHSVTLVGYSAGALSITLHMVSPMSRNLFHRAVVMSAAISSHVIYPPDQIDLARKQARLLNCSDDDVAEMINCMRKKDMMSFIQTLTDMFEFGSYHPVLLWKPVVEPDFGQERFLVEDPIKSYQEGNFARVPVIAGITKDEFASMAIDLLKNETLTAEVNSDFERLAPLLFLYERGTEKSRNASREFRRVFLNNEPLSLEKSVTGLSHLFSDSLIGFEVHQFVHLAARFTSVYYYRFSYQGRFSHFYHPERKPYGVVHHDDLIYLFHLSYITPTMFTPEDPEHKTVERLTRMWSRFAQTGNPNNPEDEYLCKIQWTPFNLNEENYLDIGDELVMKNHLYTDRYSVWERLFPLPTNQ